MKNPIAFIIALLFVVTAFGQNTGAGFNLAGGSPVVRLEGTYFANKISQEYFKDGQISLNLKEMDGSIYLNNFFLPAIIEDELTKKKEDVYLRYNIYGDFFEVKYENIGDEFLGLVKNKDFTATIGGNKFYFRSYKDKDGKKVDGYLEYVRKYKDNYLFKRHHQVIRMPKKARTTLENDVPGRIINYKSFFIQDGDTFIHLDDNKRKIADAFTKHKDAIKSFVKEKKFKLQEESDFIQIFNFYNKLESEKK